MTSPAPTHPHTRATRKELLGAGAIVIAVIAAILALNTRVLLTKPFWLEERCCTVYPVQDSRSLFDLYANVREHDVAPPLLHGMLWVVGKVTGSLDPVIVRLFAVATIAAALFLLYVVLRRHFTRGASLLGVLAVAGNRMVIHHAFEGRFYGPWLLFAVAFVWALELDADAARSRRRDVAIALSAILLCTIHWFGIISLALLAGSAVFALSRGSGWRSALRRVAPTAAGVVAFVAFVPMMLDQLRIGGDTIRWVPPLSVAQLREFAGLYLVQWPVLVGAGILLIDRIESRRLDVRRFVNDPALAGLLATIAMTLALALVSLILAPVMVHRYAIVSALFAAPIVALAAEAFPSKLRMAFAVVLALATAVVAGQAVRGAVVFSDTFATYRALEKQLEPERVPLVFTSVFLSYPVDGELRTNAPSRVLQLPDSIIRTMPGDTAVHNKIRFDRDLARLHYAGFGYPRPVTLAELDTMPKFYLFSRDVDMHPGLSLTTFGRRLFPLHKAERANPYVTRFTR